MDTYGLNKASLEAYLASQDAKERIMDGRIQPWQAALAPGDKAVWNYLAPGRGWLTIYLDIIAIPEPIKATRVYARCYSLNAPAGEPGSTHRASLWAQMTPEAFEQARERGWPHIPPEQFGVDPNFDPRVKL